MLKEQRWEINEESGKYDLCICFTHPNGTLHNWEWKQVPHYWSDRIRSKLRGYLSLKNGIPVSLQWISAFPDWPDCMTGDICWFVVDREGCDLNLSRSSVDTGVIKWLWFHPSWGVARKKHKNKLLFIKLEGSVEQLSSVGQLCNLPFYKCCGDLGIAIVYSVPGRLPWQLSVTIWGSKEYDITRKPLNSTHKEQRSWATQQPEAWCCGARKVVSPGAPEARLRYPSVAAVGAAGPREGWCRPRRSTTIIPLSSPEVPSSDHPRVEPR